MSVNAVFIYSRCIDYGWQLFKRLYIRTYSIFNLCVFIYSFSFQS